MRYDTLRSLTLAVPLFALTVPCRVSPAASPRPQTARLSLDEARAYMLQLINRDRATKDLMPVELDTVASNGGQKHSEEMASQRYLSHYNMAGKPPDQRYTEAGGVHYDRENVYLSTTRYRGESPNENASLPVTANPTFTRTEIEEIEASYFNETPPHDGHRKNILAPEHTHVGIGLARAGDSSMRTLANNQEFVDRYLEVSPIPQSCGINDEITVSGKTMGEVKLRSISVGRGPLPTSMSRAQLLDTRSYSTPSPSASYWPAPYRSSRRVQTTKDGRFTVSVPLATRGDSGLYYVAIWVEADGRDLLASLRTVVVK